MALKEKTEKEYAENFAEYQQQLIEQSSTAAGRMCLAAEKSDGSAADTFFRFFSREINAAQSGKCLIYMPDFGVRARDNRKGKVIIEVDWRGSSFNLGEDCFEFQLASKTDLSKVKLDNLNYKNRGRYPTGEWAARYHNMFLSWDDAIPLVQRVLFCDFFRQRLLMTTQSRVLGSMTTQRFMAEEVGQLMSVRSCLLNEYT